LQLGSAVIDALTAAPGGARAVVAVDDAHLLDPLSAFVLHQLVVRGAAFVIVTIRGGEPVPDAVRALWKDGYLQLLELQPLSRAESDTLLGGVRLLDDLFEPTDDLLLRAGKPFTKPIKKSQHQLPTANSNRH